MKIVNVEFDGQIATVECVPNVFEWLMGIPRKWKIYNYFGKYVISWNGLDRNRIWYDENGKYIGVIEELDDRLRLMHHEIK